VPTSRSSLFAPFDVVVVPFPYSDRLAEKRRPAIVISTSQLIARFGLIWLAMITSAENRRWECDVDVSDLRTAGLPAPSVIRPVKIATVDATRVIEKVGRLTVKDALAVEVRLKQFLG
jgi:mRNA interferase MazF